MDSVDHPSEHGTAPPCEQQHNIARHGMPRHSTARHGAASHSRAEHSSPRQGTTLHDTAQHDTAEKGTAQHTTGQAGVKRNPNWNTRRTTRSVTAGLRGDPYPHTPPTNPANKGEVTSQPVPGSNCKPQSRKAGQKRHPYPHTHHGPRNPHRNTRGENPNQKKARYMHNPHSHAQTPSPGQEQKRAGEHPNLSTHQTKTQNQQKLEEDEPLTQARTPHNSRKPSVHSPDTGAARAMQVTRPNEIRSPGVRPAPLWESRRSLRHPSTSELRYQKRTAGMPWERDTPGNPVNP